MNKIHLKSIKLAAILTLIFSSNIIAGTLASQLPNYTTPTGETDHQSCTNMMSLSQTLKQIHQREGIKSTIKQYHRLKKYYSDIYDFSEQEINRFGRSLIADGEYQDAIRVFALNVKTYPKSSNAYSSLADGYIHKGNKVLAIQHYKKSLALNPTNINALEMLNKLRKH